MGIFNTEVHAEILKYGQMAADNIVIRDKLKALPGSGEDGYRVTLRVIASAALRIRECAARLLGEFEEEPANPPAARPSAEILVDHANRMARKPRMKRKPSKPDFEGLDRPVPKKRGAQVARQPATHLRERPRDAGDLPGASWRQRILAELRRMPRSPMELATQLSAVDNMAVIYTVTGQLKAEGLIMKLASEEDGTSRWCITEKGKE